MDIYRRYTRSEEEEKRCKKRRWLTILCLVALAVLLFMLFNALQKALYDATLALALTYMVAVAVVTLLIVLIYSLATRKRSYRKDTYGGRH